MTGGDKGPLQTFLDCLSMKIIFQEENAKFFHQIKKHIKI